MISKKLKKIIDLDKHHLYQNYGDRQEVCFVKGEGSLLYDQDGRQYIDLFAGIAVQNLGHGNKAVLKALHSQLDKIVHTSNHYYNIEQIEAARLLSQLSFPGKTLFVNSGTEANEAAIKLARRYGLSTSDKRYEIVTFQSSFHGRTLGSMTATGQSKIHSGFGPLPGGFRYLPYNDIKAFKKAVDKSKKTAAVMLELVQGEGGIIPAEHGFVAEIFDICTRNGILTIVDEVQTGIGRTGKPFAYQNYGILPDVITLAKGLGGGIPVGAIHTKSFLTDYFGKGVHGSTFGGNHLAAASAHAVLKEISRPALLNNAQKISSLIFDELTRIKDRTGLIKEIRGMGLLIGASVKTDGANIVKKALESGLVINCTAGDVIRFAPALNIAPSLVKKGLTIFEKILTQEEQ